MSNSKQNLVKSADPTNWIEPTCGQIIENMKKTHDMLMESARGPMDIDRQTVLCHSEQQRKQVEDMLRAKGYVEISKGYWEL